MKTVSIEISEETIELEKARTSELMKQEDFMWCVNAVFSFKGTALVIEASLFGFLFKLLESLRGALSDGQEVLLNDEYGAYQITLRIDQRNIYLIDSFENGSVVLPLDKIGNVVVDEFSRSCGELEMKIPSLLKNHDYVLLKSTLERELKGLVV